VLIQAALAKQSGTALLASAVSQSRVGEYVADIWDELAPRDRDFGIEVPAIDTERLWETLVAHGIEEIDLLKLDYEGAEYPLLPELACLGRLNRIGSIRGEWHSRKDNDLLSHTLTTTHAHHIEQNHPHEVGLFIAHRR
jgi:hypothetical protein